MSASSCPANVNSENINLQALGGQRAESEGEQAGDIQADVLATTFLELESETTQEEI